MKENNEAQACNRTYSCTGNEPEYHKEYQLIWNVGNPGLSIARCMSCRRPFIIDVKRGKDNAWDRVWESPGLIPIEKPKWWDSEEPKYTANDLRVMAQICTGELSEGGPVETSQRAMEIYGCVGGLIADQKSEAYTLTYSQIEDLVKDGDLCHLSDRLEQIAANGLSFRFEVDGYKAVSSCYDESPNPPGSRLNNPWGEFSREDMIDFVMWQHEAPASNRAVYEGDLNKFVAELQIKKLEAFAASPPPIDTEKLGKTVRNFCDQAGPHDPERKEYTEADMLGMGKLAVLSGGTSQEALYKALTKFKESR